LEAKATAQNPVTAQDYKARSVLDVPDVAQLSSLVSLPEGDDLGKAYQRLDRSTLIELLRLLAPTDDGRGHTSGYVPQQT
jgi:type I restriction enzyme M protein